MKRAILLILALGSGVFPQQRDVRSTMPLPSPSSAGTVTLSLAEYNRLSELATKKPKELKTAPQPYALTQSAFRLRVEDSSVRGTVNISGEVLANGAAKVPLTSGLTVLEAKQVGNSLPLIQQSQSHFAILKGPASFDVSLDVASAVTSEAGRASITFPVPSASSALLTLDLPGNHANVRVEPGIITSRTSLNGHTVVDASLEPGKPVKLWWTTREVLTPTAQREVRFLSTTKTVVAVGDSQLRSVALCDVSVIQGEPTEFSVRLPQGFELTEATGSTLESKEIQGDKLILHVREPAQRTHQFLIAIERPNRETKAEAPLLTFSGSQHESGELLVEGVGAMELVPKESGGLRRMDLREVGAIAKSLARFPLQAAFRYNRRPGDEPRLNLEWKQFPDDTQVLSALVEKATITTLSNVAGKSLTEMTLRLRNHAQPFVKVQLPPGATLVTAEVGGERVQPLNAADGTRVPLLRAGFNPAGAYTVSFVYLNDGNAFTKRGAYQMGLPKIDIPINLLTWEIFLPERLEIREFAGNALSAELFSAAAQNLIDELPEEVDSSNVNAFNSADLTEISPGQIGGIIVGPNGAVVPGATVTVTNKQTGVSRGTQSDGEGRWLIDGMDAGPVSISVNQSGFNQVTEDLELSKSRPTRMGTTLQVASISETVTIQSGLANAERENRRLEEQVRKAQQAQMNAPSQNVYNLQRRVAGVLPVRMEVPKAGKSYRFVRPLVLDEETNVTFQYQTK